MDLDLTPEHELIRDTVRSFARERVAPVAEELDRESRFPVELVREMAELGLMGIPIPGALRRRRRRHRLLRDRDRGADADRLVGRDHGRGAHLARDDADLPLRLRRAEGALAPRPRLGRRLAAFGLTEPDAGSDAGATRTTAELRDGSWVVNGSKMFITNAGTELTWGVTITARTGDDEVSNLVVENGTPGYEISAPLHKLGWKASDTRELTFADCAVPEENLLGPRGQGFHQFLEILDGGRISVAAMGVGLAQGAYDLAFAYAQERTQFGKPIAQLPGGRLQARRHGGRDRGRPPARLQGRVAQGPGPAVRARGRDGEALHGRALHRVVNHALQIHGGYGFMDEFPISRLYRDQKILEIGEGTNEVQRMVIASTGSVCRGRRGAPISSNARTTTRLSGTPRRRRARCVAPSRRPART